MANAGSVAAVRAAAEQRLRGVGLFRTEFLFLARSAPPDEDEQAEAYGAACAAMAPHPVVVRTLDAGSDKRLPYLPAAAEPNPALGRRGVRLWLANAELRDTQVRALARTATLHQNLWVMVPMVAAPEEMKQVRDLFAAESGRSGPTPPLGMMVELPATALALDGFAGLIDFVSVGTNDLVQYALGADRELEWPSYLAEFNPGALRLIAQAVRAGRRLEVKVGVCGELAGKPEGAVFLVGLGVDSLSLGAASAMDVLQALQRAGVHRCQEAARSALEAQDAAEALGVLRTAAGNA
jgi:phosphotransferase system enzyme I (PtsI)